MAGFCDLPFELLRSICEYLDSPRALARLCLVSRNCSNAAQPLLFRSFRNYFQPTVSEANPLSAEVLLIEKTRLECFTQLVMERPDLASEVHAVDLSLRGSVKSNVAWTFLQNQALLKAIEEDGFRRDVNVPNALTEVDDWDEGNAVKYSCSGYTIRGESWKRELMFKPGDLLVALLISRLPKVKHITIRHHGLDHRPMSYLWQAFAFLSLNRRLSYQPRDSCIETMQLLYESSADTLPDRIDLNLITPIFRMPQIKGIVAHLPCGALDDEPFTWTQLGNSSVKDLTLRLSSFDDDTVGEILRLPDALESFTFEWAGFSTPWSMREFTVAVRNQRHSLRNLSIYDMRRTMIAGTDQDFNSSDDSLREHSLYLRDFERLDRLQIPYSHLLLGGMSHAGQPQLHRILPKSLVYFETQFTRFWHLKSFSALLKHHLKALPFLTHVKLSFNFFLIPRKIERLKGLAQRSEILLEIERPQPSYNERLGE